MVTLWVLFVKCKAPEITKEAILCKYSRHQNCSESTSWHKRIPRAGELFEEFVNCFRARCKAQRNLGLTGLQIALEIHRSHFGSRYKLGCCGHAGLFGLQFDS